MPDSSLQQYVIIAYDGTDVDALQRRFAVRDKHLETVRKLKAEGRFIEGGAILDENGKMTGSVAFVAFPSRTELDTWLNNDPYVTGNVWQKIEIKPFRCVTL
ncbi:hypothetical protein GXP67_08695 [Rhodocytophaga rosea]|uniref:YCII-related domain-containing protein n=1 Tax=Rhodocytophaga rosea TaxID=2704465 RepID=A0A6C0GG61_9BACT|nr:YciI family protein [Rhodocytophaga rosea]QHT66732.1 hypothetical protein GXP67_08695 [Rhodocytophaga rosea]